nr:MAG TPA: hypothetical protein [Caudoviricetes sp.]
MRYNVSNNRSGSAWGISSPVAPVNTYKTFSPMLLRTQ